jgi:hypothetical protein
MRHLNWTRVLAIAACFAASVTLASVCAEAQVSEGSISGTVVDASGAAVPGAQVRAVKASSGQSYRAVTNSAGNFRLSLLGVGQYNVVVRKQGFRQLSVANVRVTPASDTGLGKLALSLGEVTTTVQVSGAPALLQTTQSQISTTLSSTTIEHFPGVNENEGLDFLALMLPGVVNPRDATYSNSNGVSFSSNGIRARNNDQEIDGQFNNDNSVTGPALFLSNPDFVQQYQVITDNFGPEYGRNSGSVVNIITRSGTNQYHGDVYLTESNSGLDTLSNTQKAFEGLHQVPYFNDEFSGASFGGPIRKNKAFFFGAFDNEIIPSSGVFATGALTPTPTGLTELGACPFANAASLAALSKYGPFGVTGGNPVISGTPSIQTLTDPLNPSETCNVQMDGVQRTLSTMSHEYDGLVKIDGGGAKDHISGRWIYQKSTPLNTNAYLTSASGYPINVPSFGEDFGMSWVHNLTSNQVNEARLSYGRIVVQFGGNGIGNTIPDQTALSTALAQVGFGVPSLLGFGVPAGAPNGRINNAIQVQDNWTYIRGKHQFKAGWNWTNQRSPNIFLPFYNGGFTFSDFSSYVANIPSAISIASGDPQIPFHENDNYLYAGDDYKVKPDLTLNLGLTWAYFGQPANLFNQITVANESSSKPFFNPALPLSVRTTPPLPSIKDNFGPSVGFAYNPNWLGAGKTVIRGGYRLINDPNFYNIYLNVADSAPVVLLQTLTGSTAADNPLLAAPFGPAVRSQLASSLTLGVFDPRSFNQTTLASNLRPDRVSEWSFGVQRSLSQAMVLEARYVGNHANDLLQSINGNPYIAGLAASFPSLVPSGLTPCPPAQAVVPTAVGRVNCNEGIIGPFTNTAYSNYNALQLNLRGNNFKNQLTLLASYTWSKAMDNNSDVYSTFVGGNTSAFSQNPLNYTGAEYGLSAFDIPQNFTISFFEQLPFFRNEGGLRGHLLGGWGISGTYDLASGQPFTPYQAALNTDSGGTAFDTAFNEAFVSGAVPDNARPFAISSGAPSNSVGIFAADACSVSETIFGTTAGCSLPANTLLDFNALNASSGVTVKPTTESNVRYIVNGAEADSIFKSPFGTAGRNIGRDWWTNTGSFAIYKNFKLTERASAQFWVTAINVFNTPNFASVDPFIDDSGFALEGTGFADPQLTDGGTRVVKFGLKIFF